MISMMSIDHDLNFHADQEDHHHDYHGQDENDDHYCLSIHHCSKSLLSYVAVLPPSQAVFCIGIWMNWPNLANLTSSREHIHRVKSRRPNLFQNPASVHDSLSRAKKEPMIMMAIIL